MSFFYPPIDNLDTIYKIDNEKEMTSVLSDNLFKVKTNLNNILKRINERYILEYEVNICIDNLKFIDNLNLFIDVLTLNEFSDKMSKIDSKLNSIKGINNKAKSSILQSIKYTKMVFITHRKDFYKNLYFNKPDEISKEIENELKAVNKNGNFNDKLFKQIQNIFWIVKNKINNKFDKKNLEIKLEKLKNIQYNYDNYYYSKGKYDKYYNNYYNDYNYYNY